MRYKKIILEITVESFDTRYSEEKCIRYINNNINDIINKSYIKYNRISLFKENRSVYIDSKITIT